ALRHDGGEGLHLVRSRGLGSGWPAHPFEAGAVATGRSPTLGDAARGHRLVGDSVGVGWRHLDPNPQGDARGRSGRATAELPQPDGRLTRPLRLTERMHDEPLRISNERRNQPWIQGARALVANATNARVTSGGTVCCPSNSMYCAGFFAASRTRA